MLLYTSYHNKIDRELHIIIFMSKYDIRYEGGRCPPGYEHVDGYTNFRGIWTDAYCRKLPKHMPRKVKKDEFRDEKQFKDINEFWR